MFGGGLFNKRIGIMDAIEVIDMLTTDVEVEGRKQGYEQASKEYGKVFEKIEKEYKEAKELIKTQKDNYDKKSEALIIKLEKLEKQEVQLKKQLNAKKKEVSTKYDIPVNDITKALASGKSLLVNDSFNNAFALIYCYKKKQLRDATQEGYIEARELYEKKRKKLKKDLKDLKDKGSKEIQELINTINDILSTISEEQMKIAELEILL